MPVAHEKYITAKNGVLAKIGDTIVLLLPDSQQIPKPVRALLVAVNAEQDKNNGRYVLEKQIHALPACSIADVEVVEASSQPAKEFKPTTNAEGLRLDGPTIVEFVKAGYKAEAYPPQGFAEVLTDDEKELVKMALGEYRQSKFAVPSSAGAPIPPAVDAPSNPVAESDPKD